MFDLTHIYNKLEERQKVLNWVICGLGIHGFKISDSSKLTWDYIVENYNVEIDHYECKHLDVREIGYVIAFTSEGGFGREYDGFCWCCEHQVYGTVHANGLKERWRRT